MGNLKAELSVIHKIVDLTKKDKIDIFYEILGLDADLTENKEHFRNDTIMLGYQSEADRIIKEAVGDSDLRIYSKYLEILYNVSDHITSQEYFGKCYLGAEKISKTKISVVFCAGGRHYYD